MNSLLPLPLSLWSRLMTMGCVLLALLNANNTQAQAPAASTPKKAAIFVDNKAGKEFESKASVFEDFIASRITAKGFSVISHAQTVNALSKASATDAVLENSTSALRLAQSLGADYLVVATISSYGTEKRDFEDGGVKTLNIISTMRASYRVLEGVQGGSLAGDTLKAVKVTRGTPNAGVINDDVVNELLDELSQKIAENLGTKQQMITAVAPKPGQVEVTISCGMQDLVQHPVSIPDVRATTNGFVVAKSSADVQVLDVTVEVNGIAIGSAPGKFKVSPGLNKLKLTREGFQTWERTVNFVEGQSFKVALQMSEAGYNRWKDSNKFLLSLEADRKLNEAEVKKIEGEAQMLRQSGYKIDAKADGKSLFEGATIDNRTIRY